VRWLIAVALLAFVECAHRYKVQREPGLSVSKDEEARGTADGIRYQTYAVGVNHCCEISVEILNAGDGPVTIRPYRAEVTSPRCPVDIRQVFYEEGSGARDFDALQRELWERTLAHERRTVEIRDRAATIVVPAGSFVQLEYNPGEFRKECAPYSFALPVRDDLTIHTTFTEPR
jgi:hypothetical protein